MSTVHARYKAIKEIGTEVPLPFEVRRFFKDFTRIEIHGTDISLGEDYGSLDEVREALGWLVVQFGGKVKWEKP